MNQFEKLSRQYGTFVESDPFRNYLHYPAVLAELGDVRDRTILDIGCGDGRLARMLASAGASVYGYDSSPGQISEANALGNHGTSYFIATPETFQCGVQFDSAVSVMVLPYAESESTLGAFFASAFSNLRPGGRFISIVFNPDFDAFGDSFVCRRFQHANDGRVTVEFLSPSSGQIEFTSSLKQFSAETYEAAANGAGFESRQWKKLFPTTEGQACLGDAFWSPCSDKQPYSAFIVERDARR